MMCRSDSGDVRATGPYGNRIVRQCGIPAALVAKTDRRDLRATSGPHLSPPPTHHSCNRGCNGCRPTRRSSRVPPVINDPPNHDAYQYENHNGVHW